MSSVAPAGKDDPRAGAVLVIGSAIASGALELAGGVATYETRGCPGGEMQNEDALLVLPVDGERGVLAVADGLGGHVGGAAAAREALIRLQRAIEGAAEAGRELRDGILDGFEHANAAILEAGTGAGTTLAVVELGGGSFRTYHVGDSSILHCGGGGRLKHQTLLHSPTGYMVEAGMMSPGDALVHEERHLVSNIVGSRAMSIDLGTSRAIRPRDTILLASDGLFDNFETAEVVEGVRKGALPTATTDLVARCRERMSSGGQADDLTVLCWRPTRS